MQWLGGDSLTDATPGTISAGIDQHLISGMVGEVGIEPTTCRLSGATGYKPAALPLSYSPSNRFTAPALPAEDQFHIRKVLAAVTFMVTPKSMYLLIGQRTYVGADPGKAVRHRLIALLRNF